MKYADLHDLRDAVIEEIKEETPNVPITVEHLKLAELRLSNLLTVMLDSKTQEITERVAKMKEDRLRTRP